MDSTGYDALELAERVGGTARGPAGRASRLATAEDAGPGAVVVASDARSLERALARGPAVVVVPSGTGVAEPPPCAWITVADARLALALLSALFDARPRPPEGVDPSATVSPDASLGDRVSVGPHSVIEAGASVGAGTRIGPQCTVGAGASLGSGCRLHAGVRLYDGVEVGDRVELHSGCVLGADGFGYAVGRTGAVKIRHLGTVVVGDDVEVGANTTVDRGTLGATRIGPRTKIDNHCQVGHNVSIGSDCLIAGMTGIAGSVSIGDRAVLGGYVAVADHVSIGPDARVAGRAGVTKDVPAGETWAGFPAQPYRTWVRGLYLQGRLERIWAAVKGAVSGTEARGREGRRDER